MRAVTVALTLLALLTLASPALAKGPETGTLTGPGIDAPIEFLDQSAPLDEPTPPALDLIGMTGLFSSASSDLATPPPDPGSAHTITWHMFGGDVIVQHVYLEAEGGALIHTPDQPAVEAWGTRPGWRPAPEGLEEAITAVVEWSRGSELPGANGSWALPLTLVVVVAVLVSIGRLIPDYGAQASISLAKDSTV
jgi:hypothetical protein